MEAVCGKQAGERERQLREAQHKAETLFDAIQERGLIRARQRESELNDAIYELAGELYGIRKYWHKRIVRAGRNTLLPYAGNPPDLELAEDEIVFLDFGPVFEATGAEWEADFGRTYVLGSDPEKHRLARDVREGFRRGKEHFRQTPGITASQLFHFVREVGEQWGWEFGGPMAGHLIGQFPHERIPNDKISLYIHPRNELAIRSVDEKGQPRHWILEIHYVDRAREIGGFYEELLTL